MSYISGWGVSDRSSLFRMLVIFFSGIMCFAVILAWRAEILLSTEPYPEIVARPKLANKFKAPKVEDNSILNN